MADPVSEMTTTNPKVDGKTTSVQTLIGKIKKNYSKKFTIQGSKEIPEWSDPSKGLLWHLQGIAPYNGFNGPELGNGCFTGSSTVGYFASFSQAPGEDPKVRDVVKPDPNFDHAAGIQLLGDYLPVPLEKDKTLAEVAFFDVTNMSNCVPLYKLTMPGVKASAIGITNYTDAHGVDQALMAVWEYDDFWVYFYQAPLDQLGGTKSPWVLKGSYTGDVLKGDQSQCFALVTQANHDGDQVYLVAFREDEELHLYSVDTANMSLGYVNDWLKLVQVYKYTGVDWRFSVGLQIASPTLLRIFATDDDPHGKTTNYTIDTYVWEP